MKSRFINTNDTNKRLILIFAGWGMDWRPFRNLKADGYDIAVIWDYRNLTFNWGPLMRYDEICLLAWSLGVFAASLTIHEIEPKITKRIAVGGTLDPINDSRGIPPAIYHGTLNALTPRSLQKFYRRMCTSAQQFQDFHDNMPHRTVSELIDELQAIETHTIFHTPQVDAWDLAIIGRNDAIFPPANQLAAWRQTAPTIIDNCGHLPDFNAIISRHIIDKNLVARKFTGSASTYPRASAAQQKIAHTLFTLFNRACGATGPDSVPIYGDIIEIGCGQGALTKLYLPHHSNGTVNLWDIANINTKEYAPKARFVCCDAEVAIRRMPTRSTAMILSASTIQWFNSPASFLRECERVLVPGGYLVLSTFTSGNLDEIRQITGNGLNLPSQQGWQSMIPQNLTVFICQASSLQLTFDSPRQVMEHLRDTGVNAIGTNSSRSGLVRKILLEYPRDSQNRCILTYKPIFIIARKNDPSV